MKISRRPNSMPTIEIHLAVSLTDMKACADVAEAGSEIIQCGSNSGKSSDLVESGRHHRQHHDAENNNVDRKESPYGIDNTGLHGRVTQFDRNFCVRVYQPCNFTRALLVDQETANDLDATSRRTGGAANKTRERSAVPAIRWATPKSFRW